MKMATRGVMTVATGLVVLMLLAFVAQQAQGGRANAVVDHEAHRRLAGSEDTLADVFQRWVEKHGRVYRSQSEFQRRFQIFKENVYYMHRHNTQPNTQSTQQQQQNYWMGLNKFSDLTHEEFSARFVGGFQASSNSKLSTSELSEEELANFSYRDVVPAPSVDWRAKGAVSPVKDQGQCGSCWAFSTTGAIESMKYLTTGQKLSLSEQQLMDCNSPPNLGCDGGAMTSAFEYIRDNGGIHTEKDYPYTLHQGECRLFNSTKVTIGNFEQVPTKSEHALLQAVSMQPVSVAIDVSSVDFQHYKGGVFTGSCGTKLDHAVLAVGYGTDENGVGYWLLKNSWGLSWGEEGWFRLQRLGDSDPFGKCGINMDPSYPTKV